jgi:ribose transport system permease protein
MPTNASALAPDGQRSHRGSRALSVRQPWRFAGALVVALLVANVGLQGSVLDPDYWPAMLGTLAPFVLVAFASTFPVLSGGGGIDISVGPLASLVNCLLVATLFAHGLDSPFVAIPILLVVGATAGCVNGLLVVVGRLQPVIATLATFFVLSGLALRISPAPVTVGDNWTTGLAGTIGPVPGGLLTMGAAALIWVALGRTEFVRNLYAVGGDDVAAFSAGVNVAAVRIGAYVLSGVFATIAGIALTAVIQTSQASLAATYSLIALAAVSLGGTSLAGGRGGLTGSLLGATAIFLLQETLAAAGVPTSYVQLVYGILLIAGVVLSGITSRGR